MSTIDEVLAFLKGFVPGYAALENAVAPVFGSDVDDYGQCRAHCGPPDNWPAAKAICNACVDQIARDAIIKLLPEFAGAAAGGASGLAFDKFKDAIKDYFSEWLEKKGLSSLAGKAIPVIGWIFIIGDIANIISTLIMLKKVLNASAAAKAKFCTCPQ